jgi:transcriptional regulator with XRE-family HTH domain
MTLKERIDWAFARKRGLSAAALARACKISAASVSDWRSGKTKSIAAENLFDAARYLAVGAEWLGSGRGDREPSGSNLASPDAPVLDVAHLVGTIKALRLRASLDGSEYTIDHMQAAPDVFIEAYRRAVEIDARRPVLRDKPQGTATGDGRIHDLETGPSAAKRVATRHRR